MAAAIFLKVAAAAILDFWNFTFLTVGAVKNVELRHWIKFCRDFWIFQNGSRRHFGF